MTKRPNVRFERCLAVNQKKKEKGIKKFKMSNWYMGSGEEPAYLQHYGIKGMRWGHRKARASLSPAEQQARSARRKKIAKRVAIGVAGAAAAGAIGYGAYRAYKQHKVPRLGLNQKQLGLNPKQLGYTAPNYQHKSAAFKNINKRTRMSESAKKMYKVGGTYYSGPALKKKAMQAAPGVAAAGVAAGAAGYGYSKYRKKRKR